MKKAHAGRGHEIKWEIPVYQKENNVPEHLARYSFQSRTLSRRPRRSCRDVSFVENLRAIYVLVRKPGKQCEGGIDKHRVVQPVFHKREHQPCRHQFQHTRLRNLLRHQ